MIIVTLPCIFIYSFFLFCCLRESVFLLCLAKNYQEYSSNWFYLTSERACFESFTGGNRHNWVTETSLPKEESLPLWLPSSPSPLLKRNLLYQPPSWVLVTVTPNTLPSKSQILKKIQALSISHLLSLLCSIHHCCLQFLPHVPSPWLLTLCSFRSPTVLVNSSCLTRHHISWVHKQ